jgi:hypothetical protein
VRSIIDNESEIVALGVPRLLSASLECELQIMSVNYFLWDRSCPSTANYSTVTVTVPVAVVLPDTPDTVTTYVPGVVPELPVPEVPPPLVLLPPQESNPTVRIRRQQERPVRVRHFRARFGTHTPTLKIRPNANAVLPGNQRDPSQGDFRAALDAAVVEMIRVVVTAEDAVMLTGLLPAKLNVGRS